jgi:hypothetical protein
MGESLLAENGLEIGPALGESMGQTMGESMLAENGPEIGPALGESMGQTSGEIYRRKSTSSNLQNLQVQI